MLLKRSKIGEINNNIKGLNDKIDGRLSIQWYRWTIGGIVAIVTIWYVFSYKDVAEAPKLIQSLENKIDCIEKDMQKKDNHSDSLHIRTK